MDRQIAQCIEDMMSAAQTSSISLSAQVRAYDLLQQLGDAKDRGILPSDAVSKEFCEVYKELAPALEKAYDETALKSELATRRTPPCIRCSWSCYINIYLQII